MEKKVGAIVKGVPSPFPRHKSVTSNASKSSGKRIREFGSIGLVKQETLTFNGFVVNAHVVGDNEVEGDIQSFTDTHAIFAIDKKRFLNVDKNMLLSKLKVCAPTKINCCHATYPAPLVKGTAEKS